MTLLIIVGLMPSIRGTYWITNYNTAVHESPFYETLDSVAPLYIWGIPFLLGGIFLILASMHIVNQSTRKAFDIHIIFGGTISGLSFTLISMAAINNSLNWLTPSQNICFAVGFFTLSIIGIGSLWKNRTVKKN